MLELEEILDSIETKYGWQKAKEVEWCTQGHVSTWLTNNQKAGQATPGLALFYQG